MSFQEIFEPVVQSLSLAIAGLITFGFAQLVAILRARMNRDAIIGAVGTAAGALAIAVKSGVVSVDDLHPQNPVILQAATAALARVPDARDAVGTTSQTAAQMMIGVVGRAFLGDPYSGIAAITPPKPVG